MPGCGETSHATTNYDHGNVRPGAGRNLEVETVADVMTKDI